MSLDPTTRLLLALAAVLALSLGAARLAQRFGQPAVIGEIAIGIALGPTLLGRVLPDLHRQLFTGAPLTVLGGLAQLAVSLYAFEIGAQLAAEAGTRRSAGHRSPLPLAAVSVAVPAAVGLALAPWLVRSGGVGPHGSPGSFAVFLAAALGVTAVPVLARILHDRGLDGTPEGRLSLAAAAVGDGACWTLLALSLWLAGTLPAGHLALALAGVVGAGLLARRRARAGRDASRTAARVATGARPGAALLLGAVCLAAALSSALGLHTLFGGLVLGLLWPSARGPHGELPATAATGLGTLSTVLLPCFFLGAGQQVDLGAELTDPGFLALVGAVLAVSTAAKILPCAAVGRRGGLPWRDSLRLGVLMNTKGLTELVLLTAGQQAGLISPRLYAALLVVAVAATVLAGPALLLLRERPRATAAEPVLAPTG
ncbi:cation:proton antiporter [Kitasatospora sp. NPDC059795]|uniref:cation:proton antiporter n=1 Tax=Kitasatospora sp. NPDC059795 TaxID=3346949 RepID=UPI00364647D2